MNLYQEGRQSCKIVRSVLRGSMYVFDRRRAVRGYDLVGEKVQMDWQKIGNHEFQGFLTFDIRSFSITFQRLCILETWRGRPCSLAPGIGRNGNLSDVSSAGAPWERSSWCMLSLGWIRRRNRSRWPIGPPRSLRNCLGNVPGQVEMWCLQNANSHLLTMSRRNFFEVNFQFLLICEFVWLIYRPTVLIST